MSRTLEPVPATTEALDRRISEPSAEVIAAIAECPGDFVVLGAGGKMGLHICQMLQRSLHALQSDQQVLAVSRFSSPAATEPFVRSGIAVAAADLSEPAAYRRLSPAANVVFLAGMKFGTSSSPELLHRMNVAMPALVADHFRDSRIVALSTGCVYAFTTPQSGGSTENSPLDPPGAYAQSCLGREQAFIQGSEKYRTDCAVVRLNYSVELRYGVLVDIARKVRAGTPVNVETGYVNVIWQGDAVSQILRCLPLADCPPVIVNVTGCQTLSVRELAERFAEQFKTSAIIEGSESPTAWLSNNFRSVQWFGKPSMDLDTVIGWVAQWIDSGGPLLDKPTHFENRDGNY
jgi:nucleoside-diphosphate-sugar epimerase